MSPAQQRAQRQFATDYIDVATRIVEFREKYPDGSLQPARLDRPFEVLTIAGETYIAVVAAAYRRPDDERPGIGMAYEVFPGRTPYTKGSELQNAETSAWGRAIVAALAADTKAGIASAEEVRNRQAEQEERQAVPDGGLVERSRGRQQAEEDPWQVRPLRPAGMGLLRDLVAARSVEDAQEVYRRVFREGQANGEQDVTLDQLREVADSADVAGWLGMGGPLELLEVAKRIGKHVADEGIGILRRVEDEELAAVTPSSVGSGDAEAVRDAADTVRGTSLDHPSEVES